jgi:hypothetical protein
VPIFLKSWSLNLLESSGLVQASNGITLTIGFVMYFRPKVTIWFPLDGFSRNLMSGNFSKKSVEKN